MDKRYDRPDRNRILLFSGGLDSFIAWHYLDKPPCVYFDIGLDICTEELKVIKKLGIPVLVDRSINLVDREEEGDNKFIPGRNLYYAMLACKYSDKIIMAGVADDNVNDKNADIFREFSRTLSTLNNREIKVVSPFWEMTKADIVKWYLENVGDKEALIQTGSCYDLTKGSYCGNCTCCFRKWVALWVNGIQMPFYNRDLMAEYFKKARRGLYVSQRNSNILRAVREYLEKKTYCIDIDGVLTIETEGHDYEKRTPNVENINRVKSMYRSGHTVLLFTSRYPEDKEVTEEWLDKYAVPYNTLLFGKPYYDYIIDDKTTIL